MRKYIFILFSVLLVSTVKTEDIYINSISSAFTLDTQSPYIQVITPEAGNSYSLQDNLIISWDANDNLPLGYGSIEIFLKSGIASLYETIALV